MSKHVDVETCRTNISGIDCANCSDSIGLYVYSVSNWCLESEHYSEYIGCPTTYQTRHFFNNSKTNEDIAAKQTHTTDTFLFISHTTNVFLFKSRCNIFIGFRIIKEMPGLVGSGTPCIYCNCSFMFFQSFYKDQANS